MCGFANAQGGMIYIGVIEVQGISLDNAFFDPDGHIEKNIIFVPTF